MNSLSDIQNVYFLGIGGIGMSALAQYFALNGLAVAGYDKTPGQMTKKLADQGIAISFDESVRALPENYKNPKNTLVVYTPAVPDDLEVFVFFRENGFQIEKRAKVLGELSKEMPTLAVAGTHGKTTTSAILAHLLKQSGYKITAFLGGVVENYGTNFLCDGKEACVVEADEYDRSFLQLSPQYAAVNSMDADHLDIYGETDELIHSFHEFVDKLPSSDRLFYKKGLDLKGNSVAVNEPADYEVCHIEVRDGHYLFDLKHGEQLIKGFETYLPGEHNLMNAGMALAMALDFGANVEKLKKGLKNFEGVDRRFSYRLRTEKRILIEDYAHHPVEIAAIAHATREMYPDKKLMVVFQPHLYTRTRDFANEFGESLSLFDQVILLPIYPAREEPIPGVDAEFLLSLITQREKQLVEKPALPEAVKNTDAQVILMLGAGDIGREVEPVKKALQHEV